MKKLLFAIMAWGVLSMGLSPQSGYLYPYMGQKNITDVEQETLPSNDEYTERNSVPEDELHIPDPDDEAYAFKMGILGCQWIDSDSYYLASDEACAYLEEAYASDTTAPDYIWGQGIVAHHQANYAQALARMKEFLSHLSIDCEGGKILVDSSKEIIPRARQYSTAVFVILDSILYLDAEEANMPLVESLVSAARTLSNPHYFDLEIVKRSMRVVYYGVQYAQAIDDQELSCRYAKDYLWITRSVLGYLSSHLGSVKAEECNQVMNATITPEGHCRSIVEEYYWSGKETSIL